MRVGLGDHLGDRGAAGAAAGARAAGLAYLLDGGGSLVDGGTHGAISDDPADADDHGGGGFRLSYF